MQCFADIQQILKKMLTNCILIASNLVSLSPYWLRIKFSSHCSFTYLILQSICGTGNFSQQTSLQCLSSVNAVFSDEDKIMIKILFSTSDSLKLLGVTLDRTMSFDKHVSTVVRACNFHLSALRHIRSIVLDTVAQQIACSIVGSRLDYCNSLLVNCSIISWHYLLTLPIQWSLQWLRHLGHFKNWLIDWLIDCSDRNLDKLQRVQDNLARVVCNWNRSTSAGPQLRSLHWLPVRQRINFKLAKLCY